MFLKPLVKLVSVTLLFWVLTLEANAQVRPGVKFGLSMPYINPSDILVTDDRGMPHYNIMVDHNRYGVHAGIFLQMQIGHFFIQPEVLFNSIRIDYKIDDLSSPGTPAAHARDIYRNIDFPILMGLKTGSVRFGVGPVGHIFLSSVDALEGYDGYQSNHEDLSWGLQGGLGFDFWKLHIDLRYEESFTKLGDHLTFFGKNHDFATDDNQLIASLGLSF